MIVATIARKPLRGIVADNVAKHGVGGIAIDTCRIAGPKGDGVWTSSNATVKEGRMFNSSPGMREFRTVPHPGGRWPANVTFVHAEGCVLVGRQGEVEEWACAEGCPVVELDRQSGNVVSSGPVGAVFSDTSSRSWKNTSTAGINRISHGDEGGASRFFKKVGPDKE